MIRLLARHNIHMTAYSPFGYPSYKVLGIPFADKNFLELDLVMEMAARYGKTPAQVEAIRINDAPVLFCFEFLFVFCFSASI